MLKRLAASCALAVVIGSGVYAQDGLPRQDRPSPGQDGTLSRPEGMPPPPMEGPPPPPSKCRRRPRTRHLRYRLRLQMSRWRPPTDVAPWPTPPMAPLVPPTAWRTAPTPSVWPSTSADGNRPTRRDCSRGVVIRRDSWFHVQFCRLGSDWTTHITTKQTMAETTRDAAEWARTSKYGTVNCRMVPNGLLHSGGLHTKM